MTIEEAADILRSMYANAGRGEQSLQFHLFGIKYADELSRLGIRRIVIKADLPLSYATEISKGRKLARYVEMRRVQE